MIYVAIVIGLACALGWLAYKITRIDFKVENISRNLGYGDDNE